MNIPVISGALLCLASPMACEAKAIADREPARAAIQLCLSVVGNFSETDPEAFDQSLQVAGLQPVQVGEAAAAAELEALAFFTWADGVQLDAWASRNDEARRDFWPKYTADLKSDIERDFAQRQQSLLFLGPVHTHYWLDDAHNRLLTIDGLTFPPWQCALTNLDQETVEAVLAEGDIQIETRDAPFVTTTSATFQTALRPLSIRFHDFKIGLPYPDGPPSTLLVIASRP